MTKGPSQHVSWAELACKDAACTPYPHAWRQERAVQLCAEFEVIRAQCGDLPIVIGSAYRTPEHNRRVGGAAKSQHVEGRALDLYPPAGWTVADFWKVIHAWARLPESRLYGVGRYPSFVHIDIRPPGTIDRLTVWHGSRAWAEVKA